MNVSPCNQNHPIHSTNHLPNHYNDINTSSLLLENEDLIVPPMCPSTPITASTSPTTAYEKSNQLSYPQNNHHYHHNFRPMLIQQPQSHQQHQNPATTTSSLHSSPHMISAGVSYHAYTNSIFDVTSSTAMLIHQQQQHVPPPIEEIEFDTAAGSNGMDAMDDSSVNDDSWGLDDDTSSESAAAAAAVAMGVAASNCENSPPQFPATTSTTSQILLPSSHHQIQPYQGPKLLPPLQHSDDDHSVMSHSGNCQQQLPSLDELQVEYRLALRKLAQSMAHSDYTRNALAAAQQQHPNMFSYYNKYQSEQQQHHQHHQPQQFHHDVHHDEREEISQYQYHDQQQQVDQQYHHHNQQQQHHAPTSPTTSPFYSSTRLHQLQQSRCVLYNQLLDAGN